jgi:predicted  nucleic acid-binding Zn-ribbon protein
LESLNSEIQELHAKDESLTNEIHSILDTATESGRLIEAETRIKKLEDDLPNYITEGELTELSGGFDFVKPEIYE